MKTRQARIEELEAEMNLAESRGLTTLAKLAKSAITIEKGAMRNRERLRKQYRDPAWADPAYAESGPRASLGALLKTPLPKEIDMTTTPKTIEPKTSLARLKLKPANFDKLDARDELKKGDADDARDELKKLWRKGGTDLRSGAPRKPLAK